MQPHSMTSVMQLSVTAAAVIVAACAISFTVWTWREKRNADLVKIGVSVLRVDPDKEKQISAAREWALDLIDTNAGGVIFSPEARAQLLREPLKYSGEYFGSVGDTFGSYGVPPVGSYGVPPVEPVPRRPSTEPPK